MSCPPGRQGMNGAGAQPAAELPNSHGKSSDGASVPPAPRAPECQGLSQAGMESGHGAAPRPLPISRDEQKGHSVTNSPSSKSVWGQSSEVEGKAAAGHTARSYPTRAEPGTLPVSEPWSQA